MPQTNPIAPIYLGDVGSSGIYRISLAGLGLSTIQSFVIRDDSVISGGTGAASGFDLDFVRLSTTLTSSASTAATVPGLSVFNFTTGVTFQRGYMQPWASGDPASWNRSYLFGTDSAGISDRPSQLWTHGMA